MAAIPSTRTHEQIHHYFQLINPEIPEDRLRQCLEEHGYDTQRCEESLRKVSSQYLYQQPKVSQHSTLQTADMEGRSVSAHPSSFRRPQSHSVSTEPYPRGMPDGRSESPSLTREGQPTPGRHIKSSTWEEGPLSSHQHQSKPVWETRDPATLHVSRYPGRPVSPQPPSAATGPHYDSGTWVPLDLPRKERKEVLIEINKPDLRRSPIPPEMSNPLQTQVLSPPVEHLPSRPGGSPRVPRNQRTPNSEEINANGMFRPMVPPWINTAFSTSSPCVPQPGNEASPMSWLGKGEHGTVSYEPLDPSKEDKGDDGAPSDWVFVNPDKCKIITATSSPVSPPVVHINPQQKVHKPEHKDLFKERTSQKRKNEVGTKLKEKAYLEALLAHQKARFDLIRKRVEEKRKDVTDMRKVVSDMEADLHNKRTQKPSSFPTAEAISKLRSEKQGLLIDVECLQRDITLHLARQRETQQSDSFYQNIQPNNPYIAQSTRIRVPPQPANESPEDTETSKWSCKTCTFSNHEFLTVCEICGKPRGESHSPLPP